MTTPPARRATDPDTVDYSGERDGFSVALPMNLGTIAGRGWVSIAALVLIGGMGTFGAVTYLGYTAFAGLQSDHKAQSRSDDRLACIMSMSEDERRMFRLGGGHWSDWCPWLSNGSGILVPKYNNK
jgi:hypothetical protein